MQKKEKRKNAYFDINFTVRLYHIHIRSSPCYNMAALCVAMTLRTMPAESRFLVGILMLDKSKDKMVKVKILIGWS